MDEVRVELYNLDALEFLRSLPDKCAQMVLTDPPYNIGKASWDHIDRYVDWCSTWTKEAHRILKDNGVFYWWNNDMPKIAQIMERLRAEGLFAFNSFCIWDKGEAFRAQSHKARVAGGKTALRSWFNRCEYVLEYFKISDSAQAWARSTGTDRINSNPRCWEPLRAWYRGELERLGIGTREIAEAYTEETGRKPYMLRHYFCVSQFEIPTKEVYEAVYVRRLGFRRSYEDLRRSYEDLRHIHAVDPEHTNVFDVPVVQGAQKGSGHPCEKPQKILRRLVRCGTHPGDLVVDPFMGGGSTGVAAVAEGRAFAGNDRDGKWYKIAEDWIQAENAQLRLF